MAGSKSFAGFDRAQQNNYYWYWQRVNPKFQFYQRDPFGSGYEQQHSCCLLPGYCCGPAVDGNEHTLSAHGTSGHPAGTPITPEVFGCPSAQLAQATSNRGKPFIDVPFFKDNQQHTLSRKPQLWRETKMKTY
ncbi:PREDICTED: putative uncharacterized protein C6orf52 homolog isoform X3 [Myotis brandtii]|uniref:putative uncharacterized protein C6orf52 homolog isoform X3 n=1 Tax=Myotis brandtii TaxID=109478 RepID=UPI000703FC22|nr:PREDICTED: putative uncharacterized protein C6orf52 homolog isoform X3 [Myotis brandtii]